MPQHTPQLKSPGRTAATTAPSSDDPPRCSRSSRLHISGYTPNSAGQFDLDGSETGCLAKPFTADELAHRVRDLLDRTSRRSAT